MSHELRLERLIEASPQAVWNALVTPDAQAEWFREPGDQLVSVSIDARVGGRWDLVFQNHGQEYRHLSVFTEVDPPHRLVCETSHEWPNDEQFDSTLQVTCEPRGDATLLTLVETFQEVRYRDILAGGWPGLLDIIKHTAEHSADAPRMGTPSRRGHD